MARHLAAGVTGEHAYLVAPLSERQQRIFILSRLHGATYLEIAQQLNVSASTVQKELKLIMAICMGVAERLK